MYNTNYLRAMIAKKSSQKRDMNNKNRNYVPVFVIMMLE